MSYVENHALAHYLWPPRWVGDVDDDVADWPILRAFWNATTLDNMEREHAKFALGY